MRYTRGLDRVVGTDPGSSQFSAASFVVVTTDADVIVASRSPGTERRATERSWAVGTGAPVRTAAVSVAAVVAAAALVVVVAECPGCIAEPHPATAPAAVTAAARATAVRTRDGRRWRNVPLLRLRPGAPCVTR
jgi:hypothetical protein